MIGDGIAVTCFEVANASCEVLASEADHLFVGRIFVDGDAVGEIAADTMLGLRVGFDKWLDERGMTSRD